MRKYDKSFWSLVSIISVDGCWQWHGNVGHGSNRGPVYVDGRGRTFEARALAGEYLGVKLPKPYQMICNNPKCVNPHHIERRNYGKNY